MIFAPLEVKVDCHDVVILTLSIGGPENVQCSNFRGSRFRGWLIKNGETPLIYGGRRKELRYSRLYLSDSAWYVREVSV